jgi:nucleotide-binding universal stress UspA family protein
MSASVIVSYDGTPNDDDALALGKVLSQAGASLALAYVRHSREFDPRREEVAQHDAQRRLEQGSLVLGDSAVPRHVVLSASTGEGLAGLAEQEGASVIVFGSDYRTTPGHVEPGTTAQYLLGGGPFAVAVAPAGLRTENGTQVKTIQVFEPDGDGAAQRTAQALADRFGAELLAGAAGPRPPDLIVVGSQATGPPGRIALGGIARAQLNGARSPVMVVPHGKPVVL